MILMCGSIVMCVVYRCWVLRLMRLWDCRLLLLLIVLMIRLISILSCCRRRLRALEGRCRLTCWV